MTAIAIAFRRWLQTAAGLRPWQVGLAAAAVNLVYLIARFMVAAHGVIGALIVAGSNFVTAAQVPVHLPVLPGAGYDGQFYFRIALAPFDFARHAFGVTLDGAFRLQRVGYPLVAWLLSFGSAHLLLYALPLVNLAALAGLAWVLAKFAIASGKHPLFGLLVALYPGYALSLGRDLTEPMAAFTLVLGLYQLERKRYVPAALMLSASVLTREASTLIVMAIGVTWLLAFLRRRGGDSSGGMFLAAALPTAAFFAWQAVVVSQAGHFVLAGFAASNLGLPFTHMVPAILNRLASPLGTANLLWFLQFAGLFLVVVTALVVLRRSAAPLYVKIALVAALALMVSLTGGEWSGNADLRSLDPLWLMSWLILFGTRRLDLARWSPLVAIWLVTAAQLVLFI